MFLIYFYSNHMHSSFIGIGLLKVIFQQSDFCFVWNSRSFHGQKVDFFLLFLSKSNLFSMAITCFPSYFILMEIALYK